jgi:copper chaperone
MTQKTFSVQNIHCGHCTMTIERELKQLEGVKNASADLETKMVTVEWDAPATWDSIQALLAEINYPVAA